MSSHEMGTISPAGTARMAQMALKLRPRSKVPLYSFEFIPKPMSRIAVTCPIVRVMYAVVCVRPRWWRGSRRAYCTVSPSAATSATT
jgi:hypothetical protein